MRGNAQRELHSGEKEACVNVLEQLLCKKEKLSACHVTEWSKLLGSLASKRGDWAHPNPGKLVSLAKQIDNYESATNKMKPKWSFLLSVIGLSDSDIEVEKEENL